MRVWLMLILLAMGVGSVMAQEATEEEALDPAVMAETFYVEFNRILREELQARPLARNADLDAVAQEIAERVGCTDEVVEFDIQREAQKRGFASYTGENLVRTTRLPLLPIVNIRPISEMAEFYAADIYETNINQPGRFYREMGVGVALCRADLGVRGEGLNQQYGLFVVLGVQPNVIPVIVQNGESQLLAEDLPLQVSLSIHQENSRQMPEIFGRGEEMRFSSQPLSEGGRSLRFAEQLAWEFEECGPNTIYYELEDTAGLKLAGEILVEILCP